MWGRSPADDLRIADPTVRMAIEIAAAVVLSRNDRQLAKLASLEAAQALLGGGSSRPEIEWETVEDF